MFFIHILSGHCPLFATVPPFRNTFLTSLGVAKRGTSGIFIVSNLWVTGYDQMGHSYMCEFHLTTRTFIFATACIDGGTVLNRNIWLSVGNINFCSVFVDKISVCSPCLKRNENLIMIFIVKNSCSNFLNKIGFQANFRINFRMNCRMKFRKNFQ